MLRLLLPLAVANSVGLGFVDRGIFPDLNAGVTISAPSWSVLAAPAQPAGSAAGGAAQMWLRLDPKHKILTLYQADIALTAYPLLGEVGPPVEKPTAAPPAAPPLAAVMAQLRPQDATELRGRVDAAPRIAARDAMLEDIQAGRADAFAARADAYGVTHAVGLGTGECEAMGRIGLRPLYHFGEACVFAREARSVR